MKKQIETFGVCAGALVQITGLLALMAAPWYLLFLFVVHLENTYDKPTVATTEVCPSQAPVSVSPGEVHSYPSVTVSPTPQVWVEGHWRTAPDGITSNNLSDPSSSPKAAPTVYVEGHWRTAPDGITSNNLSAR